MGILDRARAGIVTSMEDPDAHELDEAAIRAADLCTRFNVEPDMGRRQAILEELFGYGLHERTFVKPSFHCDVGYNIHLGESVLINFDCVFLDTADIWIGDNVLIGPKVCLATPSHNFPAEQRRSLRTVARPIRICDDVWIGASATILQGVTIGEGAIVGAGAVVTHDVPPGETWAGVPARRLKG